MSVRSHLLLAISSDVHATLLVDSAFGLSRSVGATWSVVAIETPGLLQQGTGPRRALLLALARAEQLGATVTRISTGSNTPSAVVSSLVHRAHSENATMLMLGRPRGPAEAWVRPGQGLSGFVEVLAQLLPGVTVHLVCPPDPRVEAPPTVAASRVRWRTQAQRAWPGVALALAGATAIGALLEKHLHPANLVMLYLAGVVYVASTAGRAPAIITVLGSILLYDLIFVQPRWSLKPTEPQYWLAFLVMMVVGLIISQLTARTREQAMLAKARAQRTQALNGLSAALGRARDRDAVARALCDGVQSAVGAQAALVFVTDAVTGRLPDQGLPEDVDPHWARQALAGRAEVGHGTAIGGDQARRYLPLIAGDAVFGLLVLHPPAAEHDSLEDQHLVRALVNQAAIALERAALERRSIAAAVEAEVERTRNTLLAGISHDFRTPLTTIVGSATTLIEQAPAIDEAGRMTLLKTLLAEAQRLHQLSSNLLDLTRLDEGAMQTRPEWCPADELLESALDQVGPRLQGRALVLAVPPEDLVWCDPRLIDQVLVNLLDNAARHGQPGGRLRVAIELGAAQWRLIVHDDGPGIPPGQEQAIFRKFHRACGNSDSMGKGLGLAICGAIAALHGGNIVAENDDGARFTLSLPQPMLPELEREDAA